MAAGKCRSCGEDVEWYPTINGKNGIFDAAFKQGGEGYEFTPDGAVFVKDAPPHIRVRQSHWASCPNAKKHREEADAKADLFNKSGATK